MLPEKTRLSKIMSERGLCSRREADEWIRKGWVFVDGERITELGTRIDPSQAITLAEAARRQQAGRATVLLHKPVGYVSGQAEEGYRPAITLVTAERHWREDPATQALTAATLAGMAPAGRLDIDSTGLLVLTQDGRVAKTLVGADSAIEKEYLVRVEGRLSEAGLAQLNFGLSLEGVPLKRADVRWQNRDQLRFVLREGKKRQIRRMCELVGLTVVGLKRVRIGKVCLGALPMGQWRFLAPGEIF